MRVSILLLSLLVSFGLAQELPNKRQFTNPVEPTASADDPALSTRKTLSIATPASSASGSVTGSMSLPFTTEPASSDHSTSTSTSSDVIIVSSETVAPSLTTLSGSNTRTTGQQSTTSNPAAMPTALANAAAGLIAVVGLAVAL